MNKLYNTSKTYSPRVAIYWGTLGTERRVRRFMRNEYRYFRKHGVKTYSNEIDRNNARQMVIFSLIQDQTTSIRKAFEL
jgi:hypothetical protein